MLIQEQSPPNIHNNSELNFIAEIEKFSPKKLQCISIETEKQSFVKFSDKMPENG